MNNNTMDSNFYSNIKGILETARRKTYAVINFTIYKLYIPSEEELRKEIKYVRENLEKSNIL